MSALTRHAISPTTRLLAALVLGLAAMLAAILFLLQQPHLGLGLQPDFSRDQIRIAQVPDAARQHLEGTTLAGLAPLAGDGGGITLRATDRIEEPDLLPSYEAVVEFQARQEAIHRLLRQAADSGQPLRLLLAGPDGQPFQEFQPVGPSPLSSLPLTFWVQWLVALGGILIGTWVWSLRPADAAARLFATSGVGLFVSAAAASLYSSRELALDGTVIRVLGLLNHAGTYLFQIAMVVLFLSYPRRLLAPRWLKLIAATYVVLFVLDSLRWLPSTPWGSWYPILFSALAITVCAFLQWHFTKGDPVARAPVRWLGLFTVIACLFFCIVMLPGWLSGTGEGLQQAWAFLTFLVIYFGLAVGVGRYRLFELDDWAYHILLYAGATLLLLVLDALLIYVLRWDAVLSLAVSLLVIGFLYLPVRNWIWTRLTRGGPATDEAVFRDVLDIVLAEHPAQRAQNWRALLTRMFQPLEIQPWPDAPTARPGGLPLVALEEDGMSLRIGDAVGIGGCRLRYPWQGRKLFGPPHVQKVEQLIGLLNHAEESRQAFARGASQERHRIARDLHDDVGSALVSGLHQSDVRAMHQTMRDVMSEIRNVVNGLTGEAETLDALVPALRYEIQQRLDTAGIALAWELTEVPAMRVAYRQVRALRSSLREAVSNVIRHSGATEVTIEAIMAPGVPRQLLLRVSDNGHGLQPAPEHQGHGLLHIRGRLAEVGGEAEIDSSPQGTRWTLRMPLEA